LDFHVSAFWFEIADFGSKFDIFGGKQGQTSKLYTLTQKGTSWRNSTHFKPFSVKIRQASDLSRAPEKITRKWQFTYMPQSVDIIKCDKFWDNLFKG